MNGISILIPTFNDECFSLVKELQGQCSALNDTEYEILVADDGSTDNNVIKLNKKIDTLPHCTYIIRGVNTGRAANRNFLAREARYDRLLFIDCGRKIIRKNFVAKYTSENDVVYGGYIVPRQKTMKGNINYAYERACQNDHTAEKRSKHPYQNFNTCNVMIPKEVFKDYPFDETFFHYGYEDVVYGEKLAENGVKVKHIDNPLGMYHFLTNDVFIEKTEESLRTLAQYAQQIKGYSRLLDWIEKLKHVHLLWLWKKVITPLLSMMRRQLVGSHPWLFLLNIYKLTYLIEITQGNK